MYAPSIKKNVEKEFMKIENKDPRTWEIIKRRIGEILEDPYKFKPLRRPLNGLRRVHIGKSFVLVYGIIEETKTVVFVRYAHHDKVYK
jgi:YafQ family addiction module toxin component